MTTLLSATLRNRLGIALLCAASLSLACEDQQAQGFTTKMVSAGGTHTCALWNGAVSCWGNNRSGEFGNGSPLLSSPVPVVMYLMSYQAQSIAAGGSHVCAIMNAGGVQCWGSNSSGQLGTDSAPEGCSAGGSCSSSPVQVTGLTSGAQAIAAGERHTCAVVNGGVRCWGDNAHGQLGNGSTATSATPVEVSGLHGNVTAIAAGATHTCAIVDGGIRCWGDNRYGELGNGSVPAGPNDASAYSTEPVPVTGLTSGVQAIAVGDRHTCALAGGEVLCWGSNGDGELGVPFIYLYSPLAVPVTGLATSNRAIAAGGRHTCAITSDGSIQCWGGDAHGELGTGGLSQPCLEGIPCSSAPVQVSGLTGEALAISAGDAHTCAVVNEGGVQCWGSNGFGELGNNSTTDSSAPVRVRTSTGANAF